MGKGGRAREFTLSELKSHSSPGDCWFAIKGKVYDVSKWSEHPGGPVYNSVAGTDATDAFRAFHSSIGEAYLKRFEIGDLAPEAQKAMAPNAFEKEYRELYERVKANPNFSQANFVYYAWKLVSTLSILAAAVYVTVTSSSFLQSMGGAFLISLFWQQCGWLAHDFAHHQVFKNRTLNDYGVLFVGNFLQAFSLEWWKNKHNTHHAIPNLHETSTDAHDGDPDIDTLPFLAWSQKFIEKCKEGGSAASPAARFCVRNQAVLYFPILFFARITWALSSLAYAFQANVSLFGSTEEKSVVLSSSNGALRYPLLERILLIAHYTWYFSLVFLSNSLPTALCYIFVSQTFAGLLLAIAFGVGHNGMTVYDSEKRPGFCELQVTTTRNVNDTFFVGWFMGGLHYQIEHHLFPFVPRHSLHKVRPMVEALCAKHGVKYHSTGLLEGTVEILSYLDKVSEGLKSFPAM